MPLQISPRMNTSVSRLSIFLRWLARAVGLVSIVFFIVYFIATGYGFLRNELKLEANSVSFMIFSTTIGYVVAWFSELIGGIILVVGGGILAIYLMFLGGWYGVEGGMIYGVLFLIPGFLFLIADKSVSKK